MVLSCELFTHNDNPGNLKHTNCIHGLRYHTQSNMIERSAVPDFDI